MRIFQLDNADTVVIRFSCRPFRHSYLILSEPFYHINTRYRQYLILIYSASIALTYGEDEDANDLYNTKQGNRYATKHQRRNQVVSSGYQVHGSGRGVSYIMEELIFKKNCTSGNQNVPTAGKRE